MQRYLIGRVFQALVSIFVISIIVFVVARMIGDPTVLLVPPEAGPEEIADLRTRLGIDRPIYEQYLTFIGNALRGDFGQSFKWKEPALGLVLDRLPATLQLTLVAMFVATLIAIPVGVLSSMNAGSGFDRFGKAFALLGQSAPTFWVGIMLMLVFSVQFRLFPVGGRGGLQHLVLPAVTLGWYMMAAVTRLTRSTMLDVLDAEYIKMARIKGAPERIVILKHALKNAAIPVVTLISLQFAALMGGAVITGTIFAWPGVGRLAVDAIMARDYPVVQTVVFVSSILFVTINLVVDVLYAYLDPRIRYA